MAIRGVVIGLGVVAVAGLYRLGSTYIWWFGGLKDRVVQLALSGPGSLALLMVAALAVTLLGVLAAEAVLLGVEHIWGFGRHCELWANMAGRDRLLLRTSDAARFGKICRALRRALADRSGFGVDR